MVRRHDRHGAVGAVPPLRAVRAGPIARRVARASRRRHRPWRRCRRPPPRRGGAPRRAPAGRSPLRKRCSSSTAGPPWTRRRLQLEVAADRRARCRQRAARSANGAPGALTGRVAAQATRAPRGECAPCSCMWRRMSAPRLENSASRSGPIPATSDERPGRAVQRAPNVDGQPGAQMRLVDRRGGPAVRVDPASVTGAPAAVGTVDEVGHHDVAVEVRVAVAADSVGEHRRDRPTGGHHDAVGARPSGGRDAVLFEVRERSGDGPAVRRHDGVRDVGTGQGEQHADGLRRAERQVERPHGRPSRTEQHPGPRLAAFQHSAGIGRPAPCRSARARKRRSRASDPARPRAARGPGRTGNSQPCPARSRGSRAWWPPLTPRRG